MNTNFHQSQKSEAWVVFSGKTDMNWLKIFKPGFRHCYVVLNDGNHWLSVDPLSSYMDVTIHNLPQEFNLPLWLRDRGHCVVKADITRLPKQAPWMFFTCVEAVKRILGIHKQFIITPWQLYRHLIKDKGDLQWAV